MRSVSSLHGPFRITCLPVLLAMAVALLSAAFALHAQQQRPAQPPADARYGELKNFDYPRAQIGKETLRLAPGARVFDTQNLIIMPGMVPATASVLYRVDREGQVSEMWLLTAEEAAEAKKRASRPKP